MNRFAVCADPSPPTTQPDTIKPCQQQMPEELHLLLSWEKKGDLQNFSFELQSEKPIFCRKPLTDQHSIRTHRLGKCFLTTMRELETEDAIQLLRQRRSKQILSLTALWKIIKWKHKEVCYILYINSSTALQDKIFLFPVVWLHKSKLLKRQIQVRGNYTY